MRNRNKQLNGYNIYDALIAIPMYMFRIPGQQISGLPSVQGNLGLLSVCCRCVHTPVHNCVCLFVCVLCLCVDSLLAPSNEVFCSRNLAATCAASHARLIGSPRIGPIREARIQTFENPGMVLIAHLGKVSDVRRRRSEVRIPHWAGYG